MKDHRWKGTIFAKCQGGKSVLSALKRNVFKATNSGPLVFEDVINWNSYFRLPIPTYCIESMWEQHFLRIEDSLL